MIALIFEAMHTQQPAVPKPLNTAEALSKRMSDSLAREHDDAAAIDHQQRRNVTATADNADASQVCCCETTYP